MTYSKIVNPKTGRKVSISGRLGREILKQYLNVLTGGTPKKAKKHPGLNREPLIYSKSDDEKKWCEEINAVGAPIAWWNVYGSEKEKEIAHRYMCQCAIRRKSIKNKCGKVYRPEKDDDLYL